LSNPTGGAVLGAPTTTTVNLRDNDPGLGFELTLYTNAWGQAADFAVSVLRGNHDAEMFWPEVKEHFRRLIAEHHPQDVSYLQMKDAVRHRVQFPDWFFFEPGQLYVEHGCQYDPFCSFEYFMNPVVPVQPTHIEMSIAELGIRYFTNQMKVIDAMAAEPSNQPDA
jgi:hypothetical protein